MQSTDVLIIGGGPAGSTAALLLARAGKRVVLVEKSQFPRFHIGESILPRNFPLVQELGLEAKLKALPHVRKLGAEFGMGNDHNTREFRFAQGLVPGSPTFNIERSVFDQMLMTEARAAGAEVREQTVVKEIQKLSDGEVAVNVASSAGTEILRAKYMLDCSGHGTVVGRHLKTRKPMPDPRLHKTAYFAHFENVKLGSGDAAGNPTIIMCREGWFWIIAINDRVTSVGFVSHPELIKQVNVQAKSMLVWAAERSPVMRHRLTNATIAHSSLRAGSAAPWQTGENEVLADFSYTCKPFAGPGYFLVGDAGCFLDPIFSTGVTLAMMSATQAVSHLCAILDRTRSAERARRQYIKYVENSTGLFWRLIKNYYTHSFRELFLDGKGPMNVHGAIISILAGQVFPKPVFALRWRLWLFEFFVIVNKYFNLVPRRSEFSLIDADITTHSPTPAMVGDACHDSY